MFWMPIKKVCLSKLDLLQNGTSSRMRKRYLGADLALSPHEALAGLQLFDTTAPHPAVDTQHLDRHPTRLVSAVAMDEAVAGVDPPPPYGTHLA